MTVFTQPQYDKLGYLKLRGRNCEKVIRPAMLRSPRGDCEILREFNTTKREQIQLEIEERLASKLAENYIQLNDVLIRNIQLPGPWRRPLSGSCSKNKSRWSTNSVLRRPKKKPTASIEAAGIRDFEEPSRRDSRQP